MRWVRVHADEFDVHPERICAAGHSSGGHLAGLVGTTEASGSADPELDGASSHADCVVSISGDADFMVPDDDPEWTAVRDQLFGGTVEEVPDMWRSASPAHNVDADTPPFLVIHGTLDEMISIEVARNLVAEVAYAGVDHVYELVPTGNFYVLEHEAFFGMLESFLASQLHPTEQAIAGRVRPGRRFDPVLSYLTPRRKRDRVVHDPGDVEPVMSRTSSARHAMGSEASTSRAASSRRGSDGRSATVRCGTT